MASLTPSVTSSPAPSTTSRQQDFTSPVKENESTSSRSHTPSPSYSSTILKTLNEFRESNTLCDVTLCVDGRTFGAHKAVLSASSPYFKAMFCSTMKESTDCKPVIINDLSAEDMSILLEYMYTGEINLTQDNIKSIISSANYLLISSLKERCIKFLHCILTPENCLSIASTADSCECDWVKSATTKYIKDNFVSISETDSFKLLDLSFVENLISSDDTRIDREEQVFEALMRWIGHDHLERYVYFARLVRHVRFPLMSPYYLMDHVESVPLVRETPECVDLLLEAKNYHMLPDRRWQLKNKRTTPRLSMGLVNGIIAVGGIEGNAVVASTTCLLLYGNQWYMLAKMNTPRCRHGLAATGEFVYAIGGQYREGAARSSLSNVERYDPKTNTWTSVSEMLSRRSLLNVAALEGTLYAVGGCDENNSRLNTVERYSALTDNWTYVSAMSTSRSSACVVADQYLYVLGGVSYIGHALSSCEKYDPRSNSWSPIAPMLSKRASACGAILSRRIFVVGGWDGTNHLQSAETYNLDTDFWSQISPASVARWDAGIAATSDKIYVVGGFDKNAICTLDTECYDPTTDEWTKTAKLPVATHGLKCCSVLLPSKFV